MHRSPISILDDVFSRVQMAAREACTSPTEAQAIAGNYRKGRLTLHALAITLENAYGSVRSGTSADGTQWSNRMAAHYGEFAGTEGADGDPIDVFVGPFPESTCVWVINQGWPDGGFDEHKVLLGFASEAMARDAYMGSFDRGWNGLQSIVQITLEQLKWWLKHGAHKRPLSLDQLPFGAPSMNKTLWDSTAQPLTPMHKLMYELRSEDTGGLLLDSVTLPELLADPDMERLSQFDALVVPVARMSQRMDVLQRVMEMAGEGVKPTGYTISDPVRARGVMQVAVLFAMSDGQAVTVWFHNPDSTPAKITPMDELISWKWMLNKKDITIVVAPERGRELMPKEVARRIMRLVQKNSAAFQKANAKAAERMAELAGLDAEIGQLETRLGEVRHDIEKVHQRLADKAAEPKVPVDVTTPEGYRLILAGDEALALERQDELDAMFQERYVAVRNALRDLGWSGPTRGTLSKDGATLVAEIEHVGAGRNVAGIIYGVKLAGGDAVEMAHQVRDTLEQSPAELAAMVDAFLPAAKVAEPEPELQPMTPEFYASIRDNDEELRRYAGVLDGLLVARYSETVKSLIELGWESNQAGSARLGPIGLSVSKRTLEGSETIVGLSYGLSLPGDAPDSDFQLRDTLEDAPSHMAAAIDSAAKALIPAETASDRAELVAAAAEAARRGAGGITRIATSQFFTFGVDGEDGLVLTDELRAEVEAALGEPLVEHVFPGFEGEVALVPASLAAAEAAKAAETARAAEIGAAIAKVDAAYAFADASTPFKLLVARSVEDDDYSAFKSAMTIDMAVVAAGGSVAWHVSAVGKLDGVAEAAKPYLPEGAVLDFAGDVSAAIVQLQIALDVVTTNEPINRAEGKVEQADLERDNAEQFRNAIGVLQEAAMLDGAASDEDDFDAEAEFDAIPLDDPEETVLDGDFPGHPFRGNQYRKSSAESGAAVKASMRAKHHETKGNKKEARKAHRSAALSHKAAEMHAKGAAKAYHRKMAKFHGSRSGAQLDGVLDDATSVSDPVAQATAGYAIGRISSGGAVIGRALIAGGDGKAMIYQGAAGPERVKRIGSDFPFRFDDEEEELQAMVAGLFAAVPAAEPAPAEVEPPQPVEPTPEPTPPANDGDPTPSEEQVTPEPKNVPVTGANEKAVAPARSGTEQEQAAADAALAMAAGVVAELGGTFTADGFSGVGTGSAWSYGNAEVNGVTIRLAASGGGVVQVNGSPHDADGVVILSADQVRASILAVAPAPAVEPEPAVVADPAMEADRAYLQSLIEGAADALAADTGPKLEAIYAKYESDADMMALFEQAAQAYGDAVVAQAKQALVAA